MQMHRKQLPQKGAVLKSEARVGLPLKGQHQCPFARHHVFDTSSNMSPALSSQTCRAYDGGGPKLAAVHAIPNELDDTSTAPKRV